MSLHIPPLRDRPADIPLLANAFLDRFAGASGGEPARLDEATLRELSARPFRGNVRELENLMRRAAILFPGRTVELNRLLAPQPSSQRDSMTSELRSLNLRELERAAVIRSLEFSGGNRTLASRALGISVRTLRNKIRAYELA